MSMNNEIHCFEKVCIEHHKTGIYCILNSKYYYVGQAKDIRKRWRAHLNKCRKNKHENIFVQSVYNKHNDEDPYKFTILELCLEADLADRETFWVSEYGVLTGLKCMNLREPGDTASRASDLRSRTVYRFNTDGELLDAWNGIPLASINTGVSEPLISACLNKRCKHGGGFIWSYNDKVDLDDYRVIRKDDEGYVPIRTKTVLQFSITGDFIKKWDSIKEAAASLKIDNGAITHVCKRELGSTGGFIWRYEGDSVLPSDFNIIQKRCPCCKYDKNGVFIKRYDSCADAAREANIILQAIHACCKTRGTYKGFLYLYDGDIVTENDLWNMYRGNTMPIIQILEDGSEVFFSNSKEAANTLNLKDKNIRSCVCGHQQSAYGYKWRRATIDDWLKHKKNA